MRAFLAAFAAAAALAAGGAAGAYAQPIPRPLRLLQGALAQRLVQAGGRTGAYVVDLNTGQALFAASPDVPRNPASVQKLYTTSTALLSFGPSATFSTSLLGVGALDPFGTWTGTLYLRGAGDPTFGTAAFDRYEYGTGATVQQLVANLARQAGVKALSGRIVADESYFDSLRGTAASGMRFSQWVEGSLSALAFNRGTVASGLAPITHPAVYAGQQLLAALRAAKVRAPKGTPVSAGKTPPGAALLASVQSPPISTLIALTNTPSDNFFAEMLLKDLGARFGGSGTSAAGTAVVHALLAGRFGITPSFNDGSGLSRADHTTPRQVVTLLSGLATNPYFVSSLAVGGETGTLTNEMRGTPAQGRCRGKTGTLSDVASLAGYCRAADGHTLAFAFLMNSLGNSDYGHQVEARMAVALANYDG